MQKYILLIGLSLVTLVGGFNLSAKTEDMQSKATQSETVKQNEHLTINLNTAKAEQIAEVLTGVGLKKAQAIVNYRDAHGDFKKVEDVALVKGIGIATLAKNQSRILLK